jgi:hypothetical protein
MRLTRRSFRSRAPKRRKMGATAQALADVGGQGSHVGALAATHLENENGIERYQAESTSEFMDDDSPRLAFDLDSGRAYS